MSHAETNMTTTNMSGPMHRRAFLGTAVAGAAASLGAPAILSLDRLAAFAPRRRHARPFGLAVIGDSIMWGQGLSDPEKYWHKTVGWLKSELRRPISHHVFAHSGAKIEAYSWMDARPPLHGEVPNSAPSVVKQAQLVPSPGDIDLVLLDGGANDIGLTNAMNPDVDVAWIGEQARTKCGDRMKGLLCYLVGLFPNARFIVTGYYPLLSEQSFAQTDLIVDAFERAFGCERPEATIYANQRTTLLAKSYAFSNETARWLQWAVDETNALFPDRAIFVKPAIDGNRCFGCADTHLWGLEQDPARNARQAACHATGRLTVWDFERMSVGRDFDPVCVFASIMHPNAKGAQRYFEAVAAALPRFVPVWMA